MSEIPREADFAPAGGNYDEGNRYPSTARSASVHQHADVVSPICVKTEGGLGRRKIGLEARLPPRVAALGCCPRLGPRSWLLADHAGARARRAYCRLPRRHAREAREVRASPCGDRQEPVGLVRKNLIERPSTSRTLSRRRRTAQFRDFRPTAAFWPKSGDPLGVVLRWALQLPLERDLHHPYPALAMATPRGQTAPLRSALPDPPRPPGSFPKGVVNILCGDGDVAGPIVATGEPRPPPSSARVKAANILKKQHPAHRLRCILGLTRKPGHHPTRRRPDLGATECVTVVLQWPKVHRDRFIQHRR